MKLNREYFEGCGLPGLPWREDFTMYFRSLGPSWLFGLGGLIYIKEMPLVSVGLFVGMAFFNWAFFTKYDIKICVDHFSKCPHCKHKLKDMYFLTPEPNCDKCGGELKKERPW